MSTAKMFSNLSHIFCWYNKNSIVIINRNGREKSQIIYQQEINLMKFQK